MRRFLVLCFLFSVLWMTGIHALAQASERQAKKQYAAEYKVLKDFQAALKNDDRQAVADLIAYPVRLEYPLLPVKTPADFIRQWDSFFDAQNIPDLVKSRALAVAGKGIALDLAPGVWVRQGKVTPPRTAVYEQRIAAGRAAEAQFLHPSAQGYTSLLEWCETKEREIRLQTRGEGLFYYGWKKGGGLLVEPDLVMVGELEYHGMDGDVVYRFTSDADEIYVLEAPGICAAETCPRKLSILRTGDLPSSELTCTPSRKMTFEPKAAAEE